MTCNRNSIFRIPGANTPRAVIAVVGTGFDPTFPEARNLFPPTGATIYMFVCALFR
jgi:hypothetical protein